jgi:hypothetical protein
VVGPPACGRRAHPRSTRPGGLVLAKGLGAPREPPLGGPPQAGYQLEALVGGHWLLGAATQRPENPFEC